MRILVIGGGGLTGRHIVPELMGLGHEVVLFNRGRSSVAVPDGVRHIEGDKATLAAHRAEFEQLQPDAVLHMMALTRDDARQFVETFRGIAGRAVVISSGDVYLPYGRLHGTEPGPPVEYPLREDSPLRTKLGPEGEAYNKLAVEAVSHSEPSLPTTILRYPAVYGPGDNQRRFYDWVRRMADRRPAIILGEVEAGFRFSHVYGANAGHAAVLCVTAERAAGRIYNVAEPVTPAWIERVRRLGEVLDWHGRIVTVPDAEVPGDGPQPASPLNLSHHLDMDSARIRAELGYSELVQDDEAFRITAEWLLANPPASAPAPDYAAEDALIASHPAT